MSRISLFTCLVFWHTKPTQIHNEEVKVNWPGSTNSNGLWGNLGLFNSQGSTSTIQPSRVCSTDKDLQAPYGLALVAESVQERSASTIWPCMWSVQERSTSTIWPISSSRACSTDKDLQVAYGLALVAGSIQQTSTSTIWHSTSSRACSTDNLQAPYGLALVAGAVQQKDLHTSYGLAGSVQQTRIHIHHMALQGMFNRQGSTSNRTAWLNSMCIQPPQNKRSLWRTTSTK